MRDGEMERVFRSRVVRASLAATLLAAGVWGFWPYVFNDVSTAAYVNADLTRITTPISGVMTAAAPREGDYLSRDLPLELVTARTPDRSRLDELERQTALASASVDLVANQLAEIRREDAKLAERSAFFQSATLKDLGSKAERTQAEYAQCDARLRDMALKRDRARKLAATGFVADAALRSAEAAYDESAASCQAAKANLAEIHAQAEAARRGVYLNDGVGGDAPYAEQQRGRLMIRRQELMTQLVDGQAALSQLKAQLAQEQARYARAAHYQVVLPAGRLVWDLQARPGAEVAQGAPVLDLADCRNTFVTVAMPARRIENLSVGSPARVRLLGGGAWLSGHVQRIIGGAAKPQGLLYAAPMPPATPDRFTVEVAFETGERPDDGRSCDIGRAAEVRFGGFLSGRPAVASLDRKGPA